MDHPLLLESHLSFEFNAAPSLSPAFFLNVSWGFVLGS